MNATATNPLEDDLGARIGQTRLNRSKIDPKSISIPGKAREGEGGAPRTHLTIVPAADMTDGGKEGETSSTTVVVANTEFLAVIFDDVPQGARPAITSKPGDPQTGGWTPHDAAQVDSLCRSDRNTYFNCASLLSTTGEGLAARKERAAAYHVLVLDDVGTKVDRELLRDIEPTWELETSPGNFQIGFKLSPPLLDPAEVDRFQHRFADAGLTDKGALGMVRWARLPCGINGKPQYHDSEGKPFACRLHSWNPNVQYAAEELTQRLVPGLPLPAKAEPRQERPRSPKLAAGNSVYTPRAAENPVIAALVERGLYKRLTSPGKHDITCPWVSEHTDAVDDGAAYFEPNDQFDTGGFCCHHSHRDDYHIGELLERLGVDEMAARHKPSIRMKKGSQHLINDACEEILELSGDFYQMGGMLVRVKEDDFSGDVAITPVTETELTMWLSKVCDWLHYSKVDGWRIGDVPEKQVKFILRADSWSHVPKLRGLARQPYIRESDAELVMMPGHDPISRRLGVFDGGKYGKPGATLADARAALVLLDELIGEFHFADDIDRAATLSAICTAVTRPALGLAPAYHVCAPASGSGKSYLCELIALFAGPVIPARTPYPRSSEEARKAMLSILLASPAIVIFDDMKTNWTDFGAINSVLTSPTFSDRLLGSSKTATVSTEVLFLGSGNNVGPVGDMSRRVITINLNTKSATPATLSYKGKPLDRLKGSRERYVMAVLTIIEAWRSAGGPQADVPPIASYGGKWSDFCRHALIWLGLPDPATSLLEQVKTDPEGELLEAFLVEWDKQIGDKPLTVRALIDKASQGTTLYDAIRDLGLVERHDINPTRLGQYVGRHRNRIAQGLIIEKHETGERNAWRLRRVDAPSLPPLPEEAVIPAEPIAPRNPEDAF